MPSKEASAVDTSLPKLPVVKAKVPQKSEKEKIADVVKKSLKIQKENTMAEKKINETKKAEKKLHEAKSLFEAKKIKK